MTLRLLERVRELEGNEARVRELEADALLRTMDAPLDYPDEEASFCSTSSQGAPYEPNFDRDWVSLMHTVCMVFAFGHTSKCCLCIYMTIL